MGYEQVALLVSGLPFEQIESKDLWTQLSISLNTSAFMLCIHSCIAKWMSNYSQLLAAWRRYTLLFLYFLYCFYEENYNREIEERSTLMVDSIVIQALWKFFILKFSCDWSSRSSASWLLSNDADKLTLTDLRAFPADFLAGCWRGEALWSTKNGCKSKQIIQH